MAIFQIGQKIKMRGMPMTATYLGKREIESSAQDYHTGEKIVISRRMVDFIRVDGGAMDSSISEKDLSLFSAQ
jgi:hypothetical protein